MRWAILSDIHANLEAFEAVLDDLKKEEPIEKVFLGDIVGYGANPNECIDLLQSRIDKCVKGNHDAGAIGLTDINDFNENAKSAILWTSNKVLPQHKTYLSSLPLLGTQDDFTFCHATPYEPDMWNYIISFKEAYKSFQAFHTPFCFVGHSHNPAILERDSRGRINQILSQDLILNPSFRYIINVGSIGQPRDRNPQAAYGIYNSRTKAFKLKRVPYPIDKASEKIEAAGLPRSLANRLHYGQ
jgi:diadenosine tetraphosphatase ApaH/serine/threonine PP2A family protein phosphatase